MILQCYDMCSGCIEAIIGWRGASFVQHCIAAAYRTVHAWLGSNQLDVTCARKVADVFVHKLVTNSYLLVRETMYQSERSRMVCRPSKVPPAKPIVTRGC